jgi:hypothetical protein
MVRFATITVGEIKSKEIVEQLVINNVKQLSVFEQQLKGTTYGGEYRTILKYIEYVANGNSLPQTKFRHLQGVTDGITEYEFKGKHLRVYAIQLPSKKLIMFMGTKGNQDSDIVSFRSLKRSFLYYLNTKIDGKK